MAVTMRIFVFLSALLIGRANADSAYLDPHCDDRQVIVQLFEWSWDAVARECEDVLGPKGFCGISPPTDHVTTLTDQWWIRYQPVSYELESRSGTRDKLADMVRRCKAAGVNVYADVVFNQMGGGLGFGYAGSVYDGLTKSYPLVPYSELDFNPSCTIDYGNAESVRNCPLLGMNDLNQGKLYVRQRIRDYLNDLLSLGVRGFRVDAAKHMWPGDLLAIADMLDDTEDGNRPFIYQEVIDYHTEPIHMEEYFESGKVTEFNYGNKLTECIKGKRDWGCLSGFGDDMFTDGLHALVFVDNHDSQRDGYVLYYDDCCNGYEYKLASAYHLAHVYGFKRVMSSYDFSYSDQPPPYDVDMQDGCGKEWICEHRWPSIMNLVQFANSVAGLPMDNYVYTDDLVAFSRGRRGFVVIGEAKGERFYTGLPDGEYCDIISECEQTIEIVDGFGRFRKHSGDEPVVAICVDCT